MPLTPHLRALGSPALLSSATDQAALMDVGKPLALLAYLALSGVEGSRDHLVDLLWAHVPLERGRQSLRQALWQIRQRLSAESVAQEGDRLRLIHAPESDVGQFLKAVTERHPAEAVRLYTAPFFQTFAAPGALEFEQWADTMRARLHTAFVRSGEEAVRQALDAGQSDTAVSLATRLRDADLEDQAGWRLLIETLRTVGRPPVALLEAESLEAHLREQDEPIEEGTARVIADARRTSLPGNSRTEAQSPWELTELVGREAQFATILGAWTAAARGRPQFAHIVAEPGLGKTRLLQELRNRLRSAGASVALVGARPEERDAPYSLAADLVSALAELPGGRGVSKQSAASLVALDPRLASRYAEGADVSAGAEGERRRLLALGDLVESVAHERPTVLLIDDLHWADQTSARVLSGALRRISGSILVVTTSRPGRAGMPRDERATVVGLDPLSPSAIEGLLAGFGSFASDQDAAEVTSRLHALSGGSPLRALEGLREATSLGLLRLEGGKWSLADRDGLRAVWDRMRDPADRLRRLPASDRSVLVALALWARPVSIAGLEAILGTERGAIEEACGRLERAGSAVEQNGEWSPLHHTVSELIQVVATEEELRVVHRRVAELLAPGAQGPRTRREVARHLWLGGDAAGMRSAVGRWIRDARTGGDRRQSGTLLDEYCPQEVPHGERTKILSALSWLVRHPVPHWIGLPTAVTTLLLITGCGYWWMSRPDRLVSIVAPLVGGPAAFPHPVYELKDRFGRTVRRSGDTITIRGGSGSVSLSGDTAAVMVDGRVTFENLGLGLYDGTGEAPVIVFPDLDPIPVTLPPARSDSTNFVLRLTAISVNGTPLTAPADKAVGQAGRQLTITSSFRYTALCICSVVIAMTPDWMPDHSVGWQSIRAVPTPAMDGTASLAKFTVELPQQAGTYHLFFAIAAEGSAANILSQTNWKVGRTSWNDGNDIADLSPADIAQAERTGNVTRTWLYSSDATEASGPRRPEKGTPQPLGIGVAVLTLKVIP